MMLMMILPLITVLLMIMEAGMTSAQMINSDKTVLGTEFKFETPRHSEEELGSHFVPDYLMCDACYAVAFQLHRSIEKFNLQHKRFHQNIPESELIDLIDNICDINTYVEYGLKQVNGVKRLSGLGLATHTTTAVLYSGGMWPARLADLCSTYVDGIGESGIYSLYTQGGYLSHRHMRTKLCHEPQGLLARCTEVIKQHRNSIEKHTEL